ncbi:hypothetical protein O0L34_g9053 [Tuta absoluta]|nr:hypothetical protein O0L34_g9053 [Tuta absoluta]
MLLGDWKETRQGNVQLPFVSKNTLRHLKEYIYLKSVPDLLIDCAKLLCLAGYYMLKQLPELKSDVATKLDSKFSPEDLWQWLEFCIHHKDTQMLVMLLHSLQYTGNWSIVDIEKLFLNGPYKALFELKPKCASSKYYYLYDDKDFVDFELRTGDDNMYSSVDIHRYVIAAFSPVLKQLFLNEWKGANHGYIQSIDISDLSIQHLKDFIYLNKIPEVSTDCAKLITFAACYNIPELEKEAVLKIVDNLKPECFWEWIEYCVEQKHEYLLVEMLKSISILNKIDSIKDYLSKLYNSL